MRYVIKGYAPAERGQRDRMRAEIEFLTYAELVSPRYVPKLIHHDPSLRCIVIEYTDGESYAEGVVPASHHLNGALNFFRLLNADRATAKKYISLDAAEGFLRLSEHVVNARNRLSQMGTDHLPRELKIQATDLLKKLNSASERVMNKTESLISSGTVSDSIDPDQRCISPSDFGFHNAIRTNSGPKFIDFEFSGWDDPAKAAVDFALQPGVPTGIPTSSLLAAANCNQINMIKKRCETLGPVLRIKWLCIILAVLQPERLMKVLVTHPQIEPEALIYQRLIQAEKYLQQETPFDLHRSDVATTQGDHARLFGTRQ